MLAICENDMLSERKFKVENGGLSRGTYLIYNYKVPPPPMVGGGGGGLHCWNATSYLQVRVCRTEDHCDQVNNNSVTSQGIRGRGTN